MAKFKEKILARKLRNKGNSIKQIAKIIGVSKSSVSLWCNDIYLSELQRDKLNTISINAVKKGSLIANENKKRERLARLNYYKLVGTNKINKLSKRELFLVGAALYWAEGGKNQRKVVFINSDVNMILLWIKWVENCLGIIKDRLICRVEINEKYIVKLNKIENYWSKIIGVPKEQFRKASIKHVKSNKLYENDSNYYGSLQITVKKGTNINYEILGYIEGLVRAAKRDKI